MALATNLVSYWKLEDATDSVGGNTLSGTAPSYVTGKVGNCADFESSSSQYLNSSAFSGGTSWSFSLWLNNETNQTQNPISQDDVGSDRIFNLQLEATNVTLYGWTAGGTLKNTTATAHGMTTGIWYHFAGVWDSAGNMTLYKNGVAMAGAVATTGNAKTTSEVLTLGRLNAGSPSQYYDGKIDEVGYWSRALTADEILQLYNSGRGNAYPLTDTPSLYGGVAYYKLDESSGNAADSIAEYTVSNVSTATFSGGKIGNGTDLVRASSQYFTISNDLRITGGPISISCWLKPTTLPSADSANTSQGNANAYSVVTTGDAGTQVKYSITLARIGGVQKVAWMRLRENVSADTIDYTTTLTTGTWYHLVLTYDGANVVAYLNGNAIGSPVASSGNGSGGTADYLYIGAGQNNVPAAVSHLDGSVDEVAIFNRAITSTEVTRLFNGGAALQYPWSANAASFLMFF